MHWVIREERNIGIMLPDGSNSVLLDLDSVSPSCPTWSHDGKKLVFIGNENGFSNVFVYNLESSQLTKLTNGEFWATHPVWSPDDSQIAILAIPNDGIISGEPRSIYVGGTDGSNFKKVSNISDYTRGLDWHPIYNELITVTHPEDFSLVQEFNIAIFDLRGNYKTISIDILPNELVKVFQNPVWSPDGEQITFTLEAGYATSTADIYIMNRDGSNPRKLTTAEGDERNLNPSWSPDGDRLTFVSNRHHPDILTQDIYTMNIDGSNVQRITVDGFYWCPVWQP